MKIRLRVFVFLLSFAGVELSVAQNNSWQGSGNKWENAASWSLGVAPLPAHSFTLITNTSTKSITIDSATPAGNLTISNLTLGGPVGTINTLQLTNAPLQTLHIRKAFTVNSGGAILITNTTVRVGGLSGSGESMIVNGSGTLQNGGSLIVTNLAPFLIGNSGTGQVMMAGGTLDTWNVTVASNTSSRGTLTINGGTALIRGQLTIASGFNATGTVWLTGGTFTSTNETVQVGAYGGNGSLVLSNGLRQFSQIEVGSGEFSNGTITFAGGTNYSSTLTIGFTNSSSGNVWITGGRVLLTNASLIVGLKGPGQLVQSNGYALAQQMSITPLSGYSSSFLLVGGTNEIVNNLNVGSSGTGTVYATGGQMVITNGAANIGTVAPFGTYGLATISNATFLARDLKIGATELARGTFTMEAGTAVISSNLIIGNGGRGALWVKGGEFIATNDQTTTVGTDINGGGTITVSNGTLRLFYLYLGDGLNGSILTIAGGSMTIVSNLHCAGSEAAVLVTNGTLDVGGEIITSILPSGQSLTQLGGVIRVKIFRGPHTSGGGTNYVSSNMRLYGDTWVTGGTLVVTNSDQSAVLDIGTGNLNITGGTVRADSLLRTNNSIGIIDFSAGTLISSTSVISNLAVSSQRIGNGSLAATWDLNGGTHTVNNYVRILNNAKLTGCGTLLARLVVDSGGQVLASCGGTMTFGGIVTNNGLIVAENGTQLDFGQLVVNNGTIVLTNGSANFAGEIINYGTAITPSTTNSWAAGSGKWERSSYWSRTIHPSAADRQNLITNSVSKTVTIDATTPAYTLTITNLIVGGPAGTVNALQLTNAPASTLRIFNTLRIGAGGSVTVTNSNLQVDADPTGGLLVDGGTLTLATGSIAAQGFVVGVSSTGTGDVWAIGGTLTVSNAPLDVRTGSLIITGGTVVADQLIKTNSTTGALHLISGLLEASETFITNASGVLQNIGNGSAVATYHLNGGTHTVNPGLRIRANSRVTGCGTLNAQILIDSGGSLFTDCGETLVVSQIVTNNGTIVAELGTQLVFTQPVINNGTIVGTNASVQFTGGVINNGTILSPGSTNSWRMLSGKWETAGNWVMGSAPSLTDRLDLIINPGNNIVTIDAATPAGNLTISNLSISAPTGSTNTLQVTNAPAATLRVLNTLTVANGGIVSTTNSTLRVDGATTINGGYLEMNSATLTSATATVTIGQTTTGQVRLVNSTIRTRATVVGNLAGSIGTMTMVGGTLVTSNITVGSSANSTGAVWITAGNVIVTNSTSRIGSFGQGQLTFSNGVSRLSNVDVAGGSNSRGTLTMVGGEHTILAGLSLGDLLSGTGTLRVVESKLFATNTTATFINGQMTVSNSQVDIQAVDMSGPRGNLTVAGGTNRVFSTTFLGNGPNTTGSVWVSGGVLLATNETTYLGLADKSAGQLTISNGTWLARDVIVAQNTGSRGTLTVAGGVAQITSNLTVGSSAAATGTVWLTGGDLTVANGFLTIGSFGVGQMTVSNGTGVVRSAQIAASASSRGTLTIAGGNSTVLSNITLGVNATSTGSLWAVGGVLAVTNQAGSAILDARAGSLVITGGTIIVDRLLKTNAATGRLLFPAGTLSSRETAITNAAGVNQNIGNGVTAAYYHLDGGTHSINNDLRILANSQLSGCGTLDAKLVVDAGASVLADCGGTLTFAQIVTNNGVITAENFTTLRFLQPMVNNGVLSLTNAAAEFDAGFVNNGTVLTNIIVDTGTNLWIGGNAKWENATRWSLARVPSLTDQYVAITNAGNNTVTIDALTTNSPSALTISNLMVAAPAGVTNTLLLANAGTVTPLKVMVATTISDGGALVVSNSVLSVGQMGAGDVTNRQFVVDGSNRVATVQLDQGYIWASNNVTTVGKTGMGSLLINNGTYTGRNMTLGDSTGTGTLTLNGGRFELFQQNLSGGGGTISQFHIGGPHNGGPNAKGAVWVNDGEMVIRDNVTSFIGASGTGMMTVSNGSVRTGNLQILGGTLTIAGGTTELLGAFCSIGARLGATGNVWVTGGQLIATNESSYVSVGGSGGQGSLIISNGDVRVWHLNVATNSSSGTLSVFGGSLTVLSSNSLKLATVTGTVAKVDFKNATLSATNASVVVGIKGTAELSLSNAVATMRTVEVASGASGAGTLTVGASSSCRVFENIRVGIESNAVGRLRVADGGTLIATNSGTDVVIDVTGSQVQVDNGTMVVNTMQASSIRCKLFGNCPTNTPPGGGSNTISVVNGGSLRLINDLDVSMDPDDGGEVTSDPDDGGEVFVSNAQIFSRRVFLGSLTNTLARMLITNTATATVSELMVLGDSASAGTGSVAVVGSSLYVTNGSQTATLQMNKGLLTFRNSDTQVDQLKVGGVMSLTNSVAIFVNADVAASSNTVGTLTIGTSSTCTVFSNIRVGIESNSVGSLQITDGGRLVVTNTGSEIIIGPGPGEMLVENGVVVGATLRSGFLCKLMGTCPPKPTPTTPPSGGTSGGTTIEGGEPNGPSTPTTQPNPGSGGGNSGGSCPLTKDLEVAGLSNSFGNVHLINGGLLAVATGQTRIANGDDGVGLLSVSNSAYWGKEVLLGSGTRSLGMLSVFGNSYAFVSEQMEVGSWTSQGTGLVTVTGGRLYVTNASQTAELNINNGTLVINTGTVLVDKLVATGTLARVQRNSGSLAYQQLVINSSEDTDGDGLLNGWEQTYGLDPLSPTGANGAAGDPDGDGLNNLTEQTNTTDPTQPSPNPNANSWTGGSSANWQQPARWTSGSPSLSDPANYITNTSSKVVTINNGTSVSSLTITNLTVGGTDLGTNTLLVGTTNVLTVLNHLKVGTNAFLVVSNSNLQVSGVAGGSLVVDGTVTNNAGNVIAVSNTVATVIGDKAQGMIVLHGGGVIRNHDLVLGRNLGAVGTLSIAGGTNTISGSLTVGTTNGGAGHVIVTSGQLVITNNPSGVGAGSGLVVDGTVVLNQGQISVPGLRTVVGNTGAGSLSVVGGSLSLSNLIVGNVSGSHGTVHLASGHTHRLSAKLSIGDSANAIGSLLLTSGELVTTNVEAFVGHSGIGSLTISNGSWYSMDVVVGWFTNSSGTLCIAGGTNYMSTLNVGVLPNATGTVWLAGGELRLTSTNALTIIGNNGIGRMTISNGTFSVRHLAIGGSAFGRGTLEIAGGTNHIGQSFYVGYTSNATGEVWVTGGHLVTTGSFNYVGLGSVGRVTVSNGTWLVNDVNVGPNVTSRGTITIAGGLIDTTGITLGTTTCTGTGTLHVAGGTMYVTNGAGNATLDVRSGALILSSGTLVVDQLVITNPCATILRSGGILVYGSAVLDPARDDDADGLPNGYEQANGLDPLNLVDAGGDPDGDGLTTLQEFQMGSNPLADIKAIVREGVGIRVTWQAAASMTNVLQRSVGSTGSYVTNFVDIFSIINHAGGVTNYFDAGATTNAPAFYYRIRLTP